MPALITRPSGLAEIEKVNKQLTHELRTVFWPKLEFEEEVDIFGKLKFRESSFRQRILLQSVPQHKATTIL